jgi:hypothetical protein
MTSNADVIGVADHVDDAKAEGRLDAMRQIELEPSRQTRRQGRQHDRFEGAPFADRVLDGEHRTAVTHPPSASSPSAAIRFSAEFKRVVAIVAASSSVHTWSFGGVAGTTT